MNSRFSDSYISMNSRYFILNVINKQTKYNAVPYFFCNFADNKTNHSLL